MLTPWVCNTLPSSPVTVTWKDELSSGNGHRAGDGAEEDNKRVVTNVYLALRTADFFTFLMSFNKCLSSSSIVSSNTNSYWTMQIIYSNQNNYINDNSWNINPVLYWIAKPKQFPPTRYDFNYFRYKLHKDIKITPVLLSKYADRWMPI